MAAGSPTGPPSFPGNKKIYEIDGKLRILHAISGAISYELVIGGRTEEEFGHYRPCVAWHPSGEKLAYCDRTDTTMHIVDTMGGLEKVFDLHTFSAATSEFCAVCRIEWHV